MNDIIDIIHNALPVAKHKRINALEIDAEEAAYDIGAANEAVDELLSALPDLNKDEVMAIVKTLTNRQNILIHPTMSDLDQNKLVLLKPEVLRVYIRLAKKYLQFVLALKKIIQTHSEVKLGVYERSELSELIKNLKQFLLNASKVFTLKTDDAEDVRKLKQLAQLVYKNCQPFLEEIDYEVGEYVLYRGINKGKDIAQIFTNQLLSRRPDRMPLHTDQFAHDAFNEYFTKKFNHPFRNALFVTGNIKIAKDYGTPYAVFPIGDFEYLWAKNTTDLYVAYSYTEPAKDFSILNKFMNYAGVGMDSDSFASIKKDTFKWLNDDVEFSQEDLKDAIETGNEIMLWVDNYYAIRADYYDFFAKELRQLIDNGPND